MSLLLRFGVLDHWFVTPWLGVHECFGGLALEHLGDAEFWHLRVFPASILVLLLLSVLLVLLVLLLFLVLLLSSVLWSGPVLGRPLRGRESGGRLRRLPADGG